MIDLIGKKNIYFLISLLVIIPGLVSLLLFGLRLSIEFTGGTNLSFVFPQNVNQKQIAAIKTVFSEEKIPLARIQTSGKTVTLRSSPITEKEDRIILQKLQKNVGNFKVDAFETVGPTIGKETTLKALYAAFIASVLIVFYIAISFRKVPKPTSSWRFGVTTIITLVHDVLVLLGLFSLFGHFFHVEVDSLFITAVLTVMGFSVHDTIVVFDRIRENLLKGTKDEFPKVVNDSILQTLGRSLNTSLTALLVLFALLVFGGESIRWFVVALFIGIASGTYSSIFNAAPLLVLWHELDQKRKKKVQK